MKRCPECRRDYYDETLLYCLDDGSSLLDGPGVQDTESGTELLPEGILRLATGEGKTAILSQPANSIAVLPFVNMSADPDNEYFCDGLSEELLNALGKIENLKVAARTSAFSF